MRKPGRTATTAAALMIGLALIVFVTVFAAGINSSIAKTIDDSFRGEIVLQNSDGFSPFPRDAVEVARGVDGVSTVSSITYATGALPRGEGNIQLAAVDPGTLGQVLALDFKSGAGAFPRLAPDQTILDENFASNKGLGIGDTLRVRTPTERTATFRVVGTVEGELDLLGKAIIDERATSQFGRLQPNFALARLESDASPKDVQQAIDDAVKNRFPTVEVQNQSQLKDQQEDQVNQLLGLIYALLSLAIVVSVFGIVNTLALSIHERTRELGMLRAVGMSRRQVRTMVRYEAVITALIGAILGTILGVIFAVLVSRPLADEGFELSYPVGTLLVLLVLAALAGVIAAIGPARRASRLDVLRALAYE
jgi:putative ABC transport system permease protein